MVTQSLLLNSWEIWAILLCFISIFRKIGHPQTIEIFIIKKCPKLLRIYTTIFLWNRPRAGSEPAAAASLPFWQLVSRKTYFLDRKILQNFHLSLFLVITKHFPRTNHLLRHGTSANSSYWHTRLLSVQHNQWPVASCKVILAKKRQWGKLNKTLTCPAWQVVFWAKSNLTFV